MGSGAYYSPSEITIYNYDWLTTYSSSSQKVYSFYSEDAHSSSHCHTATTYDAEITSDVVNINKTWWTDYSGYPNNTHYFYVPYDNCVFGTYTYSNSYKYYTMHGSGIGNKKHEGTATLTLTFCDPQDDRCSASSTELFAQKTSFSFTFSSTADEVTSFVSIVNDGGLTVLAPDNAYAVAVSSYSATKEDTTTAKVTINFARNALSSRRWGRVFVKSFTSSLLITFCQLGNISSYGKITAPTNATSNRMAEYDDITRVLFSFPSTCTDYSGGSYAMYGTSCDFYISTVTIIDEDGSETYSLTSGVLYFSAPIMFSVYAYAIDDDGNEINGWATNTIYVYLTYDDISISICFGSYHEESKLVAIPKELAFTEGETPTYLTYNETTLYHYLYRQLSHEKESSVAIAQCVINSASDGGRTRSYGNVSITGQYVGTTSDGDFVIRLTCAERDLSYSYPLLIENSGEITLYGEEQLYGNLGHSSNAETTSLTVSIMFESRRYCNVDVSFAQPMSIGLINRVPADYYSGTFSYGIKSYYAQLSRSAVLESLSYYTDEFVENALGVSSSSTYSYIGTVGADASLESRLYKYDADASYGEFTISDTSTLTAELSDSIENFSFGIDGESYLTSDGVRYLIFPDSTPAGTYTGSLLYKIKVWLKAPVFTLYAKFKYNSVSIDYSASREVSTTLDDTNVPEFHLSGVDHRVSISWDGEYVLCEWEEDILPKVKVSNESDDSLTDDEVTFLDSPTDLKVSVITG